MTLAEFKKLVANIPDDVNLELPEGSIIDDLCYHQTGKRLLLDTQDNRPEILAEGWYFL